MDNKKARVVHYIIGSGKAGKIYWTICGREWDSPVVGTFMKHKTTCKNCLRVVRSQNPGYALSGPVGINTARLLEIDLPPIK